MKSIIVSMFAAAGLMVAGSAMAGDFNTGACKACHAVGQDVGAGMGVVDQIGLIWRDNVMLNTSPNFNIGLNMSDSNRIDVANSTNPIEMTTQNSHGLANNQNVTFLNMSGSFSVLNENAYPITVTGANTFTIPVNGIGFTSYVSNGIGIARSALTTFSALTNYNVYAFN